MRGAAALVLGILTLSGPCRAQGGSEDIGPSGGAPESGYPVDATGLPIVPEARSPEVEPVPGDPVEVLLRARESMRGTFLRRTPDTVTVRIGGVETTWPMRSVERVLVLIPARERAAMMRSQIDDRDLTTRTRLAEWMRMEGLFDEAAEELRGVLALEPAHGRAARLLEVVESLIAARDALRRPAEASPARVRPEAGAEPARDAMRVLSDEQINLLRVYEIDLTNPPPMRIEPETVTRLMEVYAESPYIPSTARGREEFLQLPEWKILDIMFRLRAREFYDDVRVLGSPETFERFRDDVQTRWLVNACATNRCHGGAEAGRFRLVNERIGGDAAVYTNFLIVNRFVTSDGRPLVNEVDPESSALFDMALPIMEAAVGHPDVRGWRPVFRSRRDRGFRAGVEWVESLYRPRPDYPIEYIPGPELEPPAPDDANGGRGQ